MVEAFSKDGLLYLSLDKLNCIDLIKSLLQLTTELHGVLKINYIKY